MRSTPKAANTNQTSPKSPSLLSKVATPFNSRKRNLAEFSIESDEPYRQYSPGETVKGSVNIRIDKAVHITHLVICLHGFVKVFSNARVPGKTISRDSALMSSGSGKRGAEYFGNGFASLFENEVALCGKGQLNAGKYEFRFELDLPSQGLPSSIDFERGTIAYMLTSTLTRPTTISPTSACHLRIKVVEDLDVARFQALKPQTFSLEAVTKKPKHKKQARRAPDDASALSKGNPQSPHATTPRLSGDPPQSPAPSESSFASTTSGSSVSWQLHSTASIAGSTNSGSRKNIGPNTRHEISASIEILRGGCLPGDTIPLHVFVSHTKAVKSLQGIIITLYRLARVDNHPAIPLGPSQQGKKPEYEDYYPKSRTGLGGLSLSSAGSSRSFRQDLSQTFAPLIVDPRSLTATVKSSVQVPEDAFPTICIVPGQMISFRYYVEVVVDLRGKLASQERVRSQFGMVSGASGYGKGDPKVSGIDGSSGLVFPLASGYGCLDTSQIRRERSVISCPFEVIVGTRDSERRRCKHYEEPQSPGTTRSRPRLDADRTSTPSVELGTDQNPGDIHQSLQESDDFNPLSDVYRSPPYTDISQTTIVPPPEQEDEVDEKSRLRRAEQRLLPSAPPDESGLPIASYGQPSAPEAVDYEDFIDRYRLHQPETSGPSASSIETISPSAHRHYYVDEHSVGELPPGAIASSDDKQELEMRRLEIAASSPSEDEEDLGAPANAQLEPTAPTLEEVDETHGRDLDESHPWSLEPDNQVEVESLPRYRK